MVNRKKKILIWPGIGIDGNRYTRDPHSRSFDTMHVGKTKWHFLRSTTGRTKTMAGAQRRPNPNEEFRVRSIFFRPANNERISYCIEMFLPLLSLMWAPSDSFGFSASAQRDQIVVQMSTAEPRQSGTEWKGRMKVVSALERQCK